MSRERPPSDPPARRTGRSRLTLRIPDDEVARPTPAPPPATPVPPPGNGQGEGTGSSSMPSPSPVTASRIISVGPPRPSESRFPDAPVPGAPAPVPSAPLPEHEDSWTPYQPTVADQLQERAAAAPGASSSVDAPPTLGNDAITAESPVVEMPPRPSRVPPVRDRIPTRPEAPRGRAESQASIPRPSSTGVAISAAAPSSSPASAAPSPAPSGRGALSTEPDSLEVKFDDDDMPTADYVKPPPSSSRIEAEVETADVVSVEAAPAYVPPPMRARAASASFPPPPPAAARASSPGFNREAFTPASVPANPVAQGIGTLPGSPPPAPPSGAQAAVPLSVGPASTSPASAVPASAAPGSAAPASTSPASGVPTSSGAFPPVSAPAPSGPLPSGPVMVASPFAVPPSGVASSSPPFPAAGTPRLVIPATPPSPIAPPPMQESPAPRKKARPWWEELFNDDFIRTMAKVTDEQIGAEADFIEESLGVQKNAMVLDLACGTGRHAIELTRRGYNVVGFDLSLSMLARAADEAHDRNQKINFLQGDMREMTFDGTFDGVYCWNTSFGFFEEEKNAQVISRVHRALKKGGQFLLDVANRDFLAHHSPSLAWFEGEGCICMDEMQVDWITSRMKVKRTMMMDDGRSKEIEYSVRLYSLHELGKILHEHGFRVVEVSGRTATPGVFFGCDSPRTLILAEKR